MSFVDIAWEMFDGPSAYRPDLAARALQSATSVDSRASAGEAYNQILSVFGNNRAGTFYPASLRAAEELRELRDASDNHWVRWVAADVLADWAGSFCVEEGFESIKLPSGEHCNVEPAVKSLAHRKILDEDDPRPCPMCGAGPDQSTEPEQMWRSVCYCGHPRYYDYKVTSTPVS